MPRIGLMAVAARYANMLTRQQEIGQIMIEVIFVEFDYVGIAPFVIRVAPRAGNAPCPAVLAMETELLGNVRCYFLMAIEAQLSLPGTLKRSVARVAILLVFRMGLDNFTRHDQRFELGIGGLCRCECENHPDSNCEKARFHGRCVIVSVHMHRENMNNCRQHHQEEDRQVEDVPECEESLV